MKLISALHFDPASFIKCYYADVSILIFRSRVVCQIILYLKKVFKFWFMRQMKESSNLNNLLYRESDAVILLSERFKPAFQKITGLPKISKLHAIGNSLTYSVQEEVCPKKKQILLVGRMDFYQKRPERFVQIWSNLEDKYPNWNVLFLGDGPAKLKTENFAKRLGLKNIRFKGFADPKDAYRESSILCMTSTFEGLPMVLLEAMQFGTVPVAFESFESLHDIITDGVTGYIIEPFDLKQYANRLESLMTDENKRIQMAQKAQKHVTEKFDIETIISHWIEIFEKI